MAHGHHGALRREYARPTWITIGAYVSLRAYAVSAPACDTKCSAGGPEGLAQASYSP